MQLNNLAGTHGQATDGPNVNYGLNLVRNGDREAFTVAGKTQLLQKMIHADLVKSQEDGRSVVVIDSQGDLINKLVRLDLFSPEAPDNLSDRLILVDPADVEYPAALNLLDSHLERVRDYSPADRERVFNGVVELYELFFGAFLSAELTQKQGVIFRYLARLRLAVPVATIYTLIKIMEDGKPYKVLILPQGLGFFCIKPFVSLQDRLHVACFMAVFGGNVR